MGQAGSAIDLESVARNEIIRTAVQRMVDAAVEDSVRNMVEREKNKIRELEDRVVQKLETLEYTISNLKQQKTATEAKFLKVQRLEDSMGKLEKQVGALEISINTTIETVIPEAKALLESFLQKSNTTTATQTHAVSSSLEGAIATTESSCWPAASSSLGSNDTTSLEPQSAPAGTACAGPNRVFHLPSTPAATNGTNYSHLVSGSASSTTAWSSACPNPEMTLGSSSSPVALASTNDAPPVSKNAPTRVAQSTHSGASPDLELLLESTPRPPLPPAFSSCPPGTRLPSTSLGATTHVDRRAQSTGAYSKAAQRTSSGTARSSGDSRPSLQKRRAVEKLHKAVQEGRVETVRKLLKQKVNINARGLEGVTAVQLAAGRGDAAMVEILLRGGALVSRRDCKGWQALHWAASGDRAGDCVDLLVEAGAALDARTRPTGDTPLHLAAHKGNEAATIRLLAAGAKVGTPNNYGETPLDLAPAAGNMRRLLGAA